MSIRNFYYTNLCNKISDVIHILKNKQCKELLQLFEKLSVKLTRAVVGNTLNICGIFT